MPFNNVKDLLPDVKCDTPPPSPSPSPSPSHPTLNIKEKKKPPKNKDIFVFTNNKIYGYIRFFVAVKKFNNCRIY